MLLGMKFPEVVVTKSCKWQKNIFYLHIRIFCCIFATEMNYIAKERGGLHQR